MFDRGISQDGSHQHSRDELVAVPIPQPHRTRTWRCECGAMEFDTYPIGPEGADHRSPPIGQAWVAPDQLSRVSGSLEDFGSRHLAG